MLDAYNEAFKEDGLPIQPLGQEGKNELAKDAIIKWGDAIRAKFKADNLHLTARTVHDGAAQAVNHLTSLPHPACYAYIHAYMHTYTHPYIRRL